MKCEECGKDVDLVTCKKCINDTKNSTRLTELDNFKLKEEITKLKQEILNLKK